MNRVSPVRRHLLQSRERLGKQFFFYCLAVSSSIWSLGPQQDQLDDTDLSPCSVQCWFWERIQAILLNSRLILFSILRLREQRTYVHQEQWRRSHPGYRIEFFVGGDDCTRCDFFSLTETIGGKRSISSSVWFIAEIRFILPRKLNECFPLLHLGVVVDGLFFSFTWPKFNHHFFSFF